MIDKSDTQRKLNRQSKLSFDDKLEEHERINLYSFEKESKKFLKPVYVGFCKSESSKLLLCELSFDKMQPFVFLKRIIWNHIFQILIPSFFHSNQLKAQLKVYNILKRISFLVIVIHLMNFIQKIWKKLFGKMKLETATDLVLIEAVFFRKNSCSLTLKRNRSHWKHKGAQDQKKYTLEGCKYCLENNENKYRVN